MKEQRQARSIVAGGVHSHALMSDGTVRAWGNNGYGQLGDGSTTARSTPAVVPGLAGITSIGGGFAHTLALKADGSALAWGLP